MTGSENSMFRKSPQQSNFLGTVNNVDIDNPSSASSSSALQTRQQSSAASTPASPSRLKAVQSVPLGQSSENASTLEQASQNCVCRRANLEDEFEIMKSLAEGAFSRILLGKHKGERMVLKAFPCDNVTSEEFQREMNQNYFLSPHPSILTCYNISYHWDNCYVFVQEFASYGDLSRFIKKGGSGTLPECQVKLLAQQVSSALDFIHGVNLVHRDLSMENILIFQKDMSVVKICDFGSTRPQGTLVTKGESFWNPFLPPEICTKLLQEKYYCYPSADVWQLGILLFVCLTGNIPWRSADILTDTAYGQYCQWLKKKCVRIPDPFQPFTDRMIRLFKRLLEPKSSKRCKAEEVAKYLTDDWVQKGASVAIHQSISPRASVDRSESTGLSNSAKSKTVRRLSQQPRSHCKRSEASRKCRSEGKINPVAIKQAMDKVEAVDSNIDAISDVRKWPSF